jgi:predicted TIM-barrel fold metal-dependent hydrolase
LANYPKLTIVAAHGAWLVCQDAQLDYLRYLLLNYPNLYLDIAATFQYMSLLNPENIRDFYIEYQDRLLYGTDAGRITDNLISRTADRYANTFTILETDQEVSDGFFGNAGNQPIKGLNLPREVLEKIYYRNAVRLYPGLKEAMNLK